MNREIETYNNREREAGNRGMKGKKRKRVPKQEYKFEPIVRKGKKGGIDGVAYRDKILLPLLYPFYEQIRDANPGKEVWLIEDNAPSQKKAARLCLKERESRGILKVEWPANSPDLHPIEDVWDYEKSLLAPKWKELRGAGKNVQERARKRDRKYLEIRRDFG